MQVKMRRSFKEKLKICTSIGWRREEPNGNILLVKVLQKFLTLVWLQPLNLAVSKAWQSSRLRARFIRRLWCSLREERSSWLTAPEVTGSHSLLLFSISVDSSETLKGVKVYAEIISSIEKSILWWTAFVIEGDKLDLLRNLLCFWCVGLQLMMIYFIVD